MRNDLTDITLVIDRSGSMHFCQQEAQNGVNCFIEEQKKGQGEAVLTLVQFDTEYDLVHRAKPISEVPHYTLEPRGMTALLDAVGRAINETGERLSNMLEEQRPGLVVFVIVTDGLENSSHEFTKQQIKEIITHQQDQYQWQFTYLGANQDAFREARGIGISSQSSATYDPDKAQTAFAGASANVGRMREEFTSGGIVLNRYTDEERQAMSEE